MCYSKEVSLITAFVFFACAGYVWRLFICNKGNYPPAKINQYTQFFKNVIIGLTFIGGFQLAEALSIYTGNDIIYRFGLIISISSTYFFLRSLEKLTGLSFKSSIMPLIVALIGVHIFSTPMTFENYHFWVRGNSHLFWALAWMIFFFYFNACTFYVLRKSRNKKFFLQYLLEVIDTSFILSIFFIVTFVILLSINFVKDAPSIWCTFAIVQFLLIPHLFRTLLRAYKHERIKQPSVTTLFLLLCGSILILAILYAALPFFTVLAMKFAFK